MDLQSKIGLKIKKLRENMELSQSQLAEMVGYKDKTSIAKIEAGKVDLPQSKILAFSKALNITPADLLDFDLCLTNSNQVIYIETTKSNPSNFINRIQSYCNKLNNKGIEEAAKRVEELTYIPEYTADNNSLLNAAHELEGASKTGQKHDNDIMDNDDEWK